MNELSATIVIPAYNAKKTIARTIEACLKQVCNLKYEVIVVDDGSTDSTADIIKKYPVKYIHQENGGPAKARNTGWKAGNGRIIIFTDSDCVPEEEWIAKHIKYYDDPEVAGVGGSYDIANPESILSRCIHNEIVKRHSKMSGNVDFIGSYNFSCLRKALEEVNGFNEDFKTASAEDNDLSYRIKNKGHKLFFDRNIKVAHYHQTKLPKYLREQFRHGIWRVKLYRLHPDMAKGDRYASVFDLIQPPVALLVLFGTIPAITFIKVLLPFIAAALSFLLVLQFSLTVSVIKREKQISYIYLFPVLFFRAFARGLGMLKGIWVFQVLGK